jgi:predicted amidohydrolase
MVEEILLPLISVPELSTLGYRYREVFLTYADHAVCKSEEVNRQESSRCSQSRGYSRNVR